MKKMNFEDMKAVKVKNTDMVKGGGLGSWWRNRKARRAQRRFARDCR